MGFLKHVAVFGWALGLGIGTSSALGPLHPNFTVRHILPTEMANIAGIGGIGLLPNGDGVIATWGGSQKSLGEVWIVPALATGTPGTPARIATGLREALGVAVVGADFYVLEKPRILKFTGSGATWTKSTLWSLPTAWYNDDQWHHFSMNLEHKDDALWFTTGMAFEPDSNDPVQRGALIKVPLSGDGFSQFARGLRNTNGLGVGPEGEFFIADNQGHWKPTNALYWVPTKNIPVNGRFFGYRTMTNNECKVDPPPVSGTNCANDPEHPPAIWMPYGIVSNSPTRPILLKDGPYAGQMIGGDVFLGGTLRYFLEKVKGEWQGAVFPMMTAGSAGINFGINQFLHTPTGPLLVASIGGGAACGLGGSDNWNWNGKCRGLDLLTTTGTPAFEMLAIRSMDGGFDIEFTQPANAAAGDAANWTVRTTVFTPARGYGEDAGKTDNNINVPVSSAELSADGKHVRLKLASLLNKRMYAITGKSAILSAAGGAALYTAAGYYTLNNEQSVSIQGPASDFGRKIQGGLHRGRVVLELPFQGAWRLEILKLDGTPAAHASGIGPRRFETAALPAGLYVVAGSAANGRFSERIQVQ